MGDEKLDDSRHSSIGEKGLDDSLPAAELPTTGANGSASGPMGEARTGPADRPIVAAQHQLSLLSRIFKVIFYVPLKILSLFGINIWKTTLQLSGDDKIDKSPLRPASTSPQKRKRDYEDDILGRDYEDDTLGSESDEEDEEEDDQHAVRDLTEDIGDYKSDEDEDFKPGEESSCSEEYDEGDTEAELSKLSIEDVTEPRIHHPVDGGAPDKNENMEKEQSQVDKKDAPPATIPTKCIDEPVSKPELTPVTVGVVG